MEVRENTDRLAEYRQGRNGSFPRDDGWVPNAAILDGPRRTYLVLLERLEESRALLRDLTARLRRGP